MLPRRSPAKDGHDRSLAGPDKCVRRSHLEVRSPLRRSLAGERKTDETLLKHEEMAKPGGIEYIHETAVLMTKERALPRAGSCLPAA